MSKNNVQNNINFASVLPIEEYNFTNDNMFSLISSIFKVSYNVLIPPDLAIGVKSTDGNWSGVLGLIKKSNADIGMALVLTEERCQVFIFTYPHRFSDVTFMTEKPKLEYTSMHVFSPFILSVWALLLFFILLVSFIIFILTNTKESYKYVLFKLFSSLLGESLCIKTTKKSRKILICSWLFFAFVISNSYKVVLSAI